MVHPAAMVIGILSDTHDRLQPTIEALKVLQQAGATSIVHCGDVGGEQILDQLAGKNACFVWGNNDWDRKGLARYAQDIGVRCLDTFGQLQLAGKSIAVAHGDLPVIVRNVLDQQQHDYLLVGHSHVPTDQRVGRVRVINPGALHRAARKTVATLDLLSDKLMHWTVG